MWNRHDGKLRLWSLIWWNIWLINYCILHKLWNPLENIFLSFLCLPCATTCWKSLHPFLSSALLWTSWKLKGILVMRQGKSQTMCPSVLQRSLHHTTGHHSRILLWMRVAEVPKPLIVACWSKGQDQRQSLGRDILKGAIWRKELKKPTKKP